MNWSDSVLTFFKGFILYHEMAWKISSWPILADLNESYWYFGSSWMLNILLKWFAVLRIPYTSANLQKYRQRTSAFCAKRYTGKNTSTGSKIINFSKMARLAFLTMPSLNSWTGHLMKELYGRFSTNVLISGQLSNTEDLLRSVCINGSNICLNSLIHLSTLLSSRALFQTSAVLSILQGQELQRGWN